MRPHPTLVLRPLAAVLLMAAVSVWVVGARWSADECPSDLERAALSAADRPVVLDLRCAAGGDASGESSQLHWGWVAATVALAGSGICLLGAAEVARRRRGRFGLRPRSG